MLSVVASAGENVGQILLTAESAGVAFKATALAVNVDSGVADNTATITTTTSKLRWSHTSRTDELNDTG